MTGRRARLPGAVAPTLRHLAVAAALVVAACAPPPPADPGATRKPVWPAPPDVARYAWEATLRSPADVGAGDDEDSRRRRQLTGEAPPTDRVLEKPAAVAARGGRIYVTDTVERHVLAFDVPRRRVFRFGLRAPGTLRKPTGIALDATGRVYVSDATLRKVVVYDGLGLYQRTIGSPDELVRPTGVAVSPDGERVYVIDRADNESDEHRVVVYDAEGRRTGGFGRRGEGPGEFNIPVQAAVARDGTVYVLDAGNFRVQAFDRAGVYLRQFGAPGRMPGTFSRPRSIAVDDDGLVYVSDATFGNVQVFKPGGELLIAVGEIGPRDLPGRYALPAGVSVDETRRLYVVDQYFAKVDVIRRLPDTR